METTLISSKIILGSSSIYRKELLQRLQIPFEIISPHVDEAPLQNELPQKTAIRLAELKARVVAENRLPAIIISSDQVASLDGISLGKPLTHSKAVAQLKLVRGKVVYFFTALCTLNSITGRLQQHLAVNSVKFRNNYTDRQIQSYLSREKPYYCAGSAKSEGLGIALIESMTGDDPTALIGLPLIALTEMLSKEGIEVI